jgi:hypothetical protein
MKLPPELMRFFGRLTTRSVLAPLSVPGGLIGAFALLLTPVAGPHHPLTYALWIFFIVWFIGILVLHRASQKTRIAALAC